MFNAALAAAPRRTIFDYNLIRIGVTVMREDMRFIEPFINPQNIDPAWVGFSVENNTHTISSFCAVSTLLNTYVTTLAYLTVSEDIGAYRMTPMRLREMIVDTYIAAGGDLRTLRFIGTKSIINTVTRDLVASIFQRAGKNMRNEGVVELFPWDRDFAIVTFGNPFTRSIHSLLQHNFAEAGQAKPLKYIFISEQSVLAQTGSQWADDLEPQVHLVVELCRPGDNGYREG